MPRDIQRNILMIDRENRPAFGVVSFLEVGSFVLSGDHTVPSLAWVAIHARVTLCQHIFVIHKCTIDGKFVVYEQACGFQILPDESEQATEGASADMVLVLAEDADLAPLESSLRLLSSGLKAYEIPPHTRTHTHAVYLKVYHDPCPRTFVRARTPPPLSPDLKGVP